MFAVLLLLLALIAYGVAVVRLRTVSGSPPPLNVTSQPVDWVLRVPRGLTQFDAIELSVDMTNNARVSYRFETQSRSNLVEFILTPASGEPIVRRVNVSRPPGGVLERLECATRATRSYSVLKFDVDLRKVFGRLGPGTYSVQLRYPRNSFEIQDGLRFDGDLVSPEATFTIRTASLADAQNSARASTDVTIVADSSEPRGYYGDAIGIVTNHLDKPVVISAYDSAPDGGEFAVRPPLRTTMYTKRWQAGTGWPPQDGGFCGVGLGAFTLPPGESVKVMIYTLGGDGVWRCQLNYRIAGTGTNGVADSGAIVIDTFKEWESQSTTAH